MAVLTALVIAALGLNPTYAAAADGDTLKDDGSRRLFLHVKNGGGGSINVTVPAQKTTTPKIAGYGILPVADMVVAVPAAGERMIGPFPAAFINDSGNVTFNYSGVTSVTMAAIQLPD